MLRSIILVGDSTSHGDLLKIREYALVGSEYHYYSEIVYMGCLTPDFYSEHAEDLKECG